MSGFTVKHMRYFEAVASHGHFGRAAEACGISQPALSLQIKDLEDRLGGRLFERAARDIHLTTLGEEFLERVRDILVRVDDLDALVRSSSGPLSGRLRLGVIPTVAPYLLPSVIKALSTRFPRLELQPHETVTQTLLQDLNASRLDFAIMALPIALPGLQEFTLFDEDFLFVRPSGEADRPVPSPAALREMRLLLLEEGHCFRDQALAFCDMTGPAARQIMEGTSLSTLVQMVGAGIGVTLIPEMSVGLETRSAEVSVLRFPKPSPKRTIGMVWRKSSPLGEDLMQIGAIVRKAAEEHMKTNRVLN